MAPDLPAQIKAAFDQFPKPARTVLLAARARIFQLAQSADVGPLTETLKWGQHAYLTETTKSGSTLRLGLLNGAPVALFTCSSSLVDGFRADFPDAMIYHGNRALTLKEPFPKELDLCLTRALTLSPGKAKSLKDFGSISFKRNRR